MLVDGYCDSAFIWDIFSAEIAGRNEVLERSGEWVHVSVEFYIRGNCDGFGGY